MRMFDLEAFKSSLPVSDSTADLNAFYGGFKYTELSNGRVQPDASWEQRNIISVPVSELPGFPALFGTTPVRVVRLHRKVSEAFIAFWDEVHRQGIDKKLRSFDGAYYPRHKLHDRSKPLSVHSWGAALDFNASTNGFGVPPERMDIPRDFVKLAEEFGMGWGGRWPGSWDGMHFEFVKPAKNALWTIEPHHERVPPALPVVLKDFPVRLFNPAGNVQVGDGTLIGDKVYVKAPYTIPNVNLKNKKGLVRIFDAGTGKLIGTGTLRGDKVYWATKET